MVGKGNLAEAINASVAAPLLFSPVELNGMWLSDGGLLSNLPVDVARSSGMDIIIAIDITSPLRNKNELRAPWEILDQITTIMIRPLHDQQKKDADIIIKPNLENVGSTDFDKIGHMIEEGEKSVDIMIDKIIYYKEISKYV